MREKTLGPQSFMLWSVLVFVAGRAQLVAACVLLAAGCVPPSSPRAPPALAAASSSPPPGPGPTVRPVPSDGWSTTSWEDRHDTMTFLVLPQMARAFQRFEGKPYPDLTCLSCHGEDAEKVQYRMPNGPPLDPRRLPRKDRPDPRVARIAAFMTDEVTPSLAEMLDKPDVGCFTCHVSKGAP